VEKLRRYLAKKEVPVTAVALAALLAAHPSRAAVPMSVDALTQHALQSMTATAGSGVILTTSPCHRLIEQGARIIMEASRQKAVVVAAVAIAGLGVIAVPVSIWRTHHGAAASGGSATFVDAGALANAQVAPVASQGADPVSARTEIDEDYRARINRLVGGDLSAITQNCAPDFTLTLPNGQSKSLAQWQRESSGFLSQFAKLNGALTVQSSQIDGDRASVTLQWHLEGVGPAAQTSHVEEDALVDSWERRNGTWVLVNTRLLSEDSTNNGVTSHF
jgi:ketosteroid isomerase-like protein